MQQQLANCAKRNTAADSVDPLQGKKRLRGTQKNTAEPLVTMDMNRKANGGTLRYTIKLKNATTKRTKTTSGI